jgi:hypothetical protein
MQSGIVSTSSQVVRTLLPDNGQVRSGKVDHEAVESGRQGVESRSPIEICWKRREQNQ